MTTSKRPVFQGLVVFRLAEDGSPLPNTLHLRRMSRRERWIISFVMLWRMKPDVLHFTTRNLIILPRKWLVRLQRISCEYLPQYSSLSAPKASRLWTKKMSWTQAHTKWTGTRDQKYLILKIIKKEFTIAQGVHVRCTRRPQQHNYCLKFSRVKKQGAGNWFPLLQSPLIKWTFTPSSECDTNNTFSRC